MGTPSLVNEGTLTALKQVSAQLQKQDYLSKILSMFHKNSTATIDDLYRAVKTRNRKDVRDSAHRPKGSSLTMGADKLAALCSQLQNWAEDGELDFRAAEDLTMKIRASFESSYLALNERLDG